MMADEETVLRSHPADLLYFDTDALQDPLREYVELLTADTSLMSSATMQQECQKFLEALSGVEEEQAEFSKYQSSSVQSVECWIYQDAPGTAQDTATTSHFASDSSSSPEPSPQSPGQASPQPTPPSSQASGPSFREQLETSNSIDVEVFYVSKEDSFALGPTHETPVTPDMVKICEEQLKDLRNVPPCMRSRMVLAAMKEMNQLAPLGVFSLISAERVEVLRKWNQRLYSRSKSMLTVISTRTRLVLFLKVSGDTRT
mmetsp:Transcript_8449/g.26043  ORF Transcript_8449/g.26043 Transcript_8449/m.26043 type:complete len:258 (-) Transcript_8449:960-1733(-)